MPVHVAGKQPPGLETVLNELFQELGDGILIVDQRGHVVYTSDRARVLVARIFGGARVVIDQPAPAAVQRLLLPLAEASFDRRSRRRPGACNGEEFVAVTLDARRLPIRRAHRLLLLRPGETNGSPTPLMSCGLKGLTPRETDVARLAARGWRNRDVARELGISPETVKRHLSTVYRKLGLAGRRDLWRRVTQPSVAEPHRGNPGTDATSG